MDGLFRVNKSLIGQAVELKLPNKNTR